MNPAVGQSRSIELDWAYSTGPQEGFQRAYSARVVDGKLVDSEYGRDLREIQRWKGGASNAFLVEASTILEAMRGSRSVLVGYRSAERAVTVHPQVKKPGEYWLVIFLGIAHSSPPKWIVEGVAVDKNRVQLSYREPKVNFRSADAHMYYFWIPLGKLDAGVYNVGMYDSGLKAVTFMRRVEVPSVDGGRGKGEGEDKAIGK